ncbi:hypothetical protein Barb4_04629 [Bacteroidales bacterium Barb4]|nr:hypothetical protein Barb4_04629 [Bacteroidales bacterium Barb4]
MCAMLIIAKILVFHILFFEIKIFMIDLKTIINHTNADRKTATIRSNTPSFWSFN